MTSRRKKPPYAGFRTVVLLVAASAALAGCTRASVDFVRADGPVEAPAAFDHRDFDRVLATYVADGRVDYAGLAASDALRPYLARLAATDPANLDDAERLAFWINAYNALTLKLVADNYPTKSILRLAPVGIRGIPFIVPKVNTPFKVDVGEVAGQVRTLDEIEHAIIRVEFDEPRIHFALVCAAISCPPLRGEAYTGARLDAQLDDQARLFLHDGGKNRIPADEETIRISKIFNWFEGDFGGDDGDVQRFLARYFDGAVGERLANAGYAVDYMGYNWTLNDQATAAQAP